MQSDKGKNPGTSQNAGSKSNQASSKNLTQNQKRIVLEYDSDLIVHVIFKKSDEKKLTCEWLLREGTNNMKAIAEKKKIQKDFSKILAFTTKTKNLLIDYWLTMPQMDLSLIEDGTVLVPYFKTKSSSTILSSKADESGDSSSRTARLADFEFIALIGRGGFSKVFLARKKENGRFYAIKKILKGDKNKFEKEKRGVQREKRNLTELKFPSFVQLHYSFQTEKNYYFVLDYIPGGDMYQHLRENIVFSEKEAKFYIAEVLLGLQTLHSNNFIHRDLKPENLLLDLRGHIHFADFGLTKMFKQRSDYHYTFCGTPEYMAPEIVTGVGYNVLADYYSLGSLAYELVVGVPPFQRIAGNSKEIFKHIVHKKPNIPHHVSDECRSFIKGLLEKKPHERLGAKEGFKELLAHPWLAGIDFDQLAARTAVAPIKIDPKSILLASVTNEAIDDSDDSVIEAKINNVDEFRVSGFSYFSLSDVGSPQLFLKRQNAMMQTIKNKSVKDKGAEETVASVLKTPKMISPNRGIRQVVIANTPLQMYLNSNQMNGDSNKKDESLNKGLIVPKKIDAGREGSIPKGFIDLSSEDTLISENCEEISNVSPHMDTKMRNYATNNAIKHMPLHAGLLPLRKVTEEEPTPTNLNIKKEFSNDKSPINFNNQLKNLESPTKNRV